MASLFGGLLILLSPLCVGFDQASLPDSISIPVAGNSWVVDRIDNKDRIVTKEGIRNWMNEATVISTFFRVEQTGSIKLAMRAKVPSGASTIRVTFAGQSRDIELSNGDYAPISIGTFHVTQSGYQSLDMQGLFKTARTYADITDVLISGEATRGKVYYVKDDFYFGRRGPSVHLTYKIPETVKDVLYFYNEITIPQGEDVVGSFFMANGFGQGYFGMQVNSQQERRILFSVWSPYRTDNPQDIPEDQRIKLLKKGKAVHAGKFGGEGSGGQSYHRYMWRANTTYCFLLKGEPAENNATEFSAWFYAPEIGKWELIASFRRPKTSTYLTRLHSFLENFIPATGQYGRKGLYANQWVRDIEGQWYELVQARFTADATARKEARLDYAGGAEGASFFMKNCGFFNERTEIGAVFTRKANGREPSIDFALLP